MLSRFSRVDLSPWNIYIYILCLRANSITHKSPTLRLPLLSPPRLNPSNHESQHPRPPPIRHPCPHGRPAYPPPTIHPTQYPHNRRTPTCSSSTLSLHSPGNLQHLDRLPYHPRPSDRTHSIYHHLQSFNAPPGSPQQSLHQPHHHRHGDHRPLRLGRGNHLCWRRAGGSGRTG